MSDVSSFANGPVQSIVAADGFQVYQDLSIRVIAYITNFIWNKSTLHQSS